MRRTGARTSEAAGSGTLDGHEAPTSHRPDAATAARAEDRRPRSGLHLRRRSCAARRLLRLPIAQARPAIDS